MHICPNGRSTRFWSIVTQHPRTLLVCHGGNMVFILEVEAKAQVKTTYWDPCMTFGTCFQLLVHCIGSRSLRILYSFFGLNLDIPPKIRKLSTTLWIAQISEILPHIIIEDLMSYWFFYELQTPCIICCFYNSGSLRWFSNATIFLQKAFDGLFRINRSNARIPLTAAQTITQ